MSLFDGCELPIDERALEILSRISELWEENACTRRICKPNSSEPEIVSQRISIQLKDKLVRLSTISPKALEDMLNEEASLHNILLFAENFCE